MKPKLQALAPKYNTYTISVEKGTWGGEIDCHLL